MLVFLLLGAACGEACRLRLLSPPVYSRYISAQPQTFRSSCTWREGPSLHLSMHKLVISVDAHSCARACIEFTGAHIPVNISCRVPGHVMLMYLLDPNYMIGFWDGILNNGDVRDEAGIIMECRFGEKHGFLTVAVAKSGWGCKGTVRFHMCNVGRSQLTPAPMHGTSGGPRISMPAVSSTAPPPAREVKDSSRFRRRVFHHSNADVANKTPALASRLHRSSSFSFKKIQSVKSVFRPRIAKSESYISTPSAASASNTSMTTSSPSPMRLALHTPTHTQKPKSSVRKKGKGSDHAGVKKLPGKSRTQGDEQHRSLSAEVSTRPDIDVVRPQVMPSRGSFREFLPPDKQELDEQTMATLSMPPGTCVDAMELAAVAQSRMGAPGTSGLAPLFASRRLNKSATALLQQVLPGILDGWSDMPQALQSLMIRGFQLNQAEKVVIHEKSVIQHMYVVFDGTFSATSSKVK